MDTPLRRIRKKRELTQKVVAEAVGIQQNYYSRLENGDCTASPETAEKLSLYFGGALTELEILYPERFVAKGEAA